MSGELSLSGSAGDGLGLDPFELVSPDEDWEKYEAKTAPRHTATRLKACEPLKYETLKRALEEGAALTTMARSHKVGINTLYAIIENELGGIESYHAGLAQKFKKAANIGVDKVMELLPHEKDAAKAAIVTGIMVEKHALLAGLPTAITEVRHTVSSEVMEQWNAKLAAMRATSGPVIEMAADATIHDSAIHDSPAAA